VVVVSRAALSVALAIAALDEPRQFDATLSFFRRCRIALEVLGVQQDTNTGFVVRAAL
jgi:hypothetical protein